MRILSIAAGYIATGIVPRPLAVLPRFGLTGILCSLLISLFFIIFLKPIDKKRLIYLLLAVSLALPASAQSYIGFNGKVPECSSATDPQVSVSEIANGKRVTIVFPGAKVRSDRQFTGTQKLFIPGCADESHAGMN